MLLLIFFTTKSTWGFQLRCESISMPRYLMQYSLFKCLLFKERLKEKSCNLFWGGWNIMKFDFSIFRESLLALSQVWTLIIQNLSYFVVSGGFYSHKINLHRLQKDENQTVLKSSGSHLYITKTTKDQEQNPVGFHMLHYISLMWCYLPRQLVGDQ